MIRSQNPCFLQKLTLKFNWSQYVWVSQIKLVITKVSPLNKFLQPNVKWMLWILTSISHTIVVLWRDLFMTRTGGMIRGINNCYVHMSMWVFFQDRSEKNLMLFLKTCQIAEEIKYWQQLKTPSLFSLFTGNNIIYESISKYRDVSDPVHHNLSN